MPPTVMWSTRSGAGPPLLLLHGIGATHHDFDRVCGPLSERFDVLSVDLPGHGRSPRLGQTPTVAALTDELESHLDDCGVETAHVLGNSLGGRLALELAARGRARSVTAIAPFGPATPVERIAQGTVLATAGIVMMGLRPVSSRLARRWWGRSVLLAGVRMRPWAASPVEAASFAWATGSRGYWQTLVANAADVPFDVVAIRCPVALAQGVGDWISGAQTVRYQALVPGATMTWLTGAGHVAQSDAPDSVVELVCATALRSRDPDDVHVAARTGDAPTHLGMR
jgi:pimeloyl-ACP methyl ester carboxylesterase